MGFGKYEPKADKPKASPLKDEKPAAPKAPKPPATCKYCHTVTGDGTDACDAHKEPEANE